MVNTTGAGTRRWPPSSGPRGGGPGGGGGGLRLLLALLPPLPAACLREDVLGLLLLALLAGIGSQGLLLYFSRSGAYPTPDNGKGAVFAGHTVLVAAPDAAAAQALAGGVLEEFARYGSAVWLYGSGAGRVCDPQGAGREERALPAALERVAPGLVVASESMPELDAALERLEKRPLLLRGLTAEEPEDLYGENLLATQQPVGLSDLRWERRLRLPVSPRLCRPGRLYDGPAPAKAGETALDTALSASTAMRCSGRRGTRPSASSAPHEQPGSFLYDYYIDPAARRASPSTPPGRPRSTAVIR